LYDDGQIVHRRTSFSSVARKQPVRGAEHVWRQLANILHNNIELKVPRLTQKKVSTFWEAALNQEQLTTIEDVQRAMFAQRYIADRSLATAVFLALRRRKPLLLEGEPGVGKTEIAKVLAAMLDTKLIRLQCYEGIDVSTAEYEWNYTRQM